MSCSRRDDHDTERHRAGGLIARRTARLGRDHSPGPARAAGPTQRANDAQC